MQDAKIKKIYVAAFEGAKTAEGGEIMQGSGLYACDGLTLLRVGDHAGSTAVITAGAGHACVVDGAPVAIVGSPLSNGDTIAFSPVSALTFHELEDKPIKGLLDPAYHPVRA